MDALRRSVETERAGGERRKSALRDHRWRSFEEGRAVERAGEKSWVVYLTKRNNLRWITPDISFLLTPLPQLVWSRGPPAMSGECLAASLGPVPGKEWTLDGVGGTPGQVRKNEGLHSRVWRFRRSVARTLHSSGANADQAPTKVRRLPQPATARGPSGRRRAPPRRQCGSNLAKGRSGFRRKDY